MPSTKVSVRVENEGTEGTCIGREVKRCCCNVPTLVNICSEMLTNASLNGWIEEVNNRINEKISKLGGRKLVS